MPQSRRTCCHCGQSYEPDPRNRWHQRYCFSDACRQASKAASQRRWLASPRGRGYFRGKAHSHRVRVWRAAHPRYWRRRPRSKGALQDFFCAQSLTTKDDGRKSGLDALQDRLLAQGQLLLGLVASLTKSALQEHIDSTIRRLILLGRRIERRQTADGGAAPADTGSPVQGICATPRGGLGP
jgi:hypothetical protein